MTKFEWPWHYSFPPFYSLQPNLSTRQKQLEAWTSLLLSFHRHHKKNTLDVSEAEASPLFNNKSINRKLTTDFIYIILEELRKSGHLEWTDKQKRQCLIMWRSPEEWGNLIYKWASDTGHTNSVCTFFELTEGDDTNTQEFHSLEKWLLIRSLKSLEAQKKAEIMMFDGNEGVKFLQ